MRSGVFVENIQKIIIVIFKGAFGELPHASRQSIILLYQIYIVRIVFLLADKMKRNKRVQHSYVIDMLGFLSIEI